MPEHVAEASLVRRSLVAFGRFWWDFLVGDTPELFVGMLVVVGVVVGLVQLGARDVAIGVAPALVIALLVGSSLRGRSRA